MCEDYPCCGHRYGECENRAEFTSGYWSNYIDRRLAQGYDLDDPDFYPEED